MRKLRLISCLVFISLLVFPVAEKARHELKHLHEHCDNWHTHFCASEHTCTVCDYLFSAQADPDGSLPDLILPGRMADEAPAQTVNGFPAAKRHAHFLRGPPAC